LKILLLTHSFNCLSQRLFIELRRLDHELSVEFDINDVVTQHAVELFQPDLIIAPYLKRAIPETIWRKTICFIIHPGIAGDRGPSALDWAIMYNRKEWGVTVLQANAEMDSGDIWASETFPMRFTKKSSLYRHEVVEAATKATLTAVTRFESRSFRPTPLDYTNPMITGQLHQPIRQADRHINWQRDKTVDILRKIHAADGFPGVLDTIQDKSCYLFDATLEDRLTGKPGTILARRHNAICRATTDGAIWIGHIKLPSENEPTFKIAATQALADDIQQIPELHIDPLASIDHSTHRDIWYEQQNNVGYLHFDFYNGAMDTRQCERLRDAYLKVTERDIQVIVLMGGPDFWSNGIHLNHIEHALSPADESWRNINAINDLAEAIIKTENQLTIAALQGNAGAGGVFLSLAADQIYARSHCILNPHYKSMGNLYGSEYWSYLLPRRVQSAYVNSLTQNRLPIDAKEAHKIGLIDGCFELSSGDFKKEIIKIAEMMALHSDFSVRLKQKKQRRRYDELQKPLQSYRNEELSHMKLNFYGFDPSYHVARYHFVHKTPHSWTPLYLARHRQK